jgi:4-alpha-glucanotransferase
MRVLQFAFGEQDSLHAPHRHEPNGVVYTGTHDNDTSRGWFAAADEGTRARVLTYLGTAPDEVPWALVRAAYTSVADLAIVPLQDLLGLGGEARMNTPARAAGNWAWRIRGDAVPADLPARLRALGEAAARRPPQPPG